MTLLIRAKPDRAVDLALAAAAAVIVRAGGALWITTTQETIARELALAGCAVERTDAPPAPPDRGVLCIGRSLAPLARSEHEQLTVRVLPLGEATRRVLARRWPLGSTAARRATCRDLLHGSDALVEWERRVWLARDAARASARAVRPVLFDRNAAVTPRPGGVVLASAGAISRWAFA